MALIYWVSMCISDFFTGNHVELLPLRQCESHFFIVFALNMAKLILLLQLRSCRKNRSQKLDSYQILQTSVRSKKRNMHFFSTKFNTGTSGYFFIARSNSSPANREKETKEGQTPTIACLNQVIAVTLAGTFLKGKRFTTSAPHHSFGRDVKRIFNDK